MSGEKLEPGWFAAEPAEVEEAVQLANNSFESFRQLTGKERGQFLRVIATRIESVSEELTARAVAESGLPTARIQG